MGRVRKPMTDQQRINRQMANADPEKRQHRAIMRAIKRHQTPPNVAFGPGKPPVGRKSN